MHKIQDYGWTVVYKNGYLLMILYEMLGLHVSRRLPGYGMIRIKRHSTRSILFFFAFSRLDSLVEGTAFFQIA
jgi:hypothetical protein